MARKRSSRNHIIDLIGTGGLASLESAGFAVVRVSDVMPLIEAMRGPMLTDLMMGSEGVQAAPECKPDENTPE